MHRFALRVAPAINLRSLHVARGEQIRSGSELDADGGRVKVGRAKTNRTRMVC